MPCFPNGLFMKDVFENLEVVVLSFKEAEEGAHFVKTAEEAVQYLESKDFNFACRMLGKHCWKDSSPHYSVLMGISI